MRYAYEASRRLKEGRLWSARFAAEIAVTLDSNYVDAHRIAGREVGHIPVTDWT